jgi:hypothetical protein
VHPDSKSALLFILTLVEAIVALVVAFERGLIAGVLAGAIGLVVALLIAGLIAGWMRPRPEGPSSPGRRGFLGLVGIAGIAALAGGAGVGRALRRLTRPDPRPVLDAMARDIGADVLELVRRTYRPGRSGDLQLILAPWSTSNYRQESVRLMPNDPRSSHALPWMYLERVPIAVHAPGIVEPSDGTERVTLADLAPTASHLMRFDGFEAPDGAPLPRIERPSVPPKVIVTFVIDGGGWYVLTHWKDAWPNLRRLLRESAVYRNAITGSFPAVTACAHATIGTGAFPRTHGITGHKLRDGGSVRRAYGKPGRAQPSDILVPTLADAWMEVAGSGCWAGEIGYQIWHLGMLGRGGMPLGQNPVAVYWDEARTGSWQPQNPDLYRLPIEVPPLSVLQKHQARYHDPGVDAQFDRFAPGLRAVCCSPPIIRYQGDLIEATFDSEAIGRHDGTDLLYVNYKSPDYTGHVYNMVSLKTKFALQEVDEQLGRLSRMLASRFAPGEYALIVTADHGQCPTVDLAGGVRVDPIQLRDDLNREFGGPIHDVVTRVVPSEVYLDDGALWDVGASRDDVAAFLRDYRYRDNIGPYVSRDAIEWNRLDQKPFAAVLSTDYIEGLGDRDLSSFGPGRYLAESDPDGVPPVTW